MERFVRKRMVTPLERPSSRIGRLSSLSCALLALGCCAPQQKPSGAETPPESASPEVSPESPPEGAARPSPLAQTRVIASGIVVRGLDAEGGPALELCARRRVGPCPGLILLGSILEAHVSTEDRLVPVAVHGSYDGDRLNVERVELLPPSEEDDSPDRYRNPCPEYQSAATGPVNGSERLQAEMQRIRVAHEDRIAGVVWDRPRQTMVIRVTGDAGDIERSLKLGPRDRMCLVGNAARSDEEFSAASARLMERLRGAPLSLLGVGKDELTGRAQVRLEVLDQATRRMIVEELGEDTQIESFLELTEASLAQLPLPRERGDLPLSTSSSRSNEFGMQALGTFALHVDREARCVYFLSPGSAERVMPVLPFGFQVRDNPVRLLDQDGQIVAREGEPRTYGGGNTSVSPASAALACGAKHAWVGYP